MKEIQSFDDLRDYYNAKVTPHLTPSMEKMIEFIGHIDDFMNPPEVLKRRITDMANNPYSVDWMDESLKAFDETLANPPKEKGVLAAIVSFDANQGLDDPTSDEEAATILKQISEVIKEALEHRAPSKSEL